jgi:hypothetical protein
MLNQVATQEMVTVVEDEVYPIKPDPNAVNHRITVERGTATTGTVTLTAKADDGNAAESVYNSSGSALSWDLTSAGAVTYVIANTPVDELYVNQNSSNGTIKVSYACW